jgi:hypothetical protein
MSESRDFSAWKIALVAVGAALGLNLLLRAGLKLEGTYVTFICAGGVAVLTMLWIAKVVRRAPTDRERINFLLLYSIFLAVISFVLVVMLAALNVWTYPGGIVFLIIHYVLYPFFAMMFLSKKQLAAIFKSEPNP